MFSESSRTTGEVTRDAGAGTAGLGLVAEAPSLGTSTVVVGAGGPGIVAGTTLEAGAAANVARIVAAPLQMAGGPKAANAPGVPSSGLTTTTICAPADILVSEVPLQPPETALTLYWKNGKVTTTDGPYADPGN
jgi:hypothetical protein